MMRYGWGRPRRAQHACEGTAYGRLRDVAARFVLVLVLAALGLLSLAQPSWANHYYGIAEFSHSQEGGYLKHWSDDLSLGNYGYLLDNDFWTVNGDDGNFIESGIIIGTFCGTQDSSGQCTQTVGPYRVPRFFWGDQRCCGGGYHAHVDVRDVADLNEYWQDHIQYQGGDIWYAESGPWSGYSTSNPLDSNLLETGTEATTKNEAYACNSQTELTWYDSSGNSHSDWPDSSIYAQNPPYATWVGTAHLHDWANVSKSSCYGSDPGASARAPAARDDRPSADSTALTESQIDAMAVGFSASLGDPSPTSIEYAEGPRNQAVSLSSEDTVPDTSDSLLIVVQGDFMDDNVPEPPGDSDPTGSVLTLVVDAQSGELTDFGIQDDVPDLSSLGPVTVINSANATEKTPAADARAIGVFESCGGPPPGRCYPQHGSVSVINSRRRRVARERVSATGHFSFELRPGRYTLVARNTAGVRWSRSLKAVAHKATRANIVIPFP